MEQIIDVPVMKQGRVPDTQTLQKVLADRVVVPVMTQRHAPVSHIQETVEVHQKQFIDKAVDVPIVLQRQVPIVRKMQKTVEVPQAQSTDKVINGRSNQITIANQRGRPSPTENDHVVQEAENHRDKNEVNKTKIEDENGPEIHCVTMRNTSIVKELRSKFEVGHTKEAPARNRSDKKAQERADLTNQRQAPAIRVVQKTVEVPRVQYIDKVADIPVDVQRPVSIPDDPCSNETADEDRLEHENKKRRLPMPAEAAGKTLFVSIASDNEAEDESDKQQDMILSLVQGGESMLVDETDARSPGRQMVQVVHAEWAQELREVRKKFADDVTSEMTDVKNELEHVRELLGVLVRRERHAETKAEIAARRLDRMEREQHEADDAEHEASLEEALSNQSKAVKVLVDKWFVDKGYGFGKAPTGEIVFIHASTVQGAEVLTIGTDAWVQVVSDDARAQGEVSSKKSLGAKRVEGREGQRASEQSGPTSEASGGADCRACSSV